MSIRAKVGSFPASSTWENRSFGSTCKHSKEQKHHRGGKHGHDSEHDHGHKQGRGHHHDSF